MELFKGRATFFTCLLLAAGAVALVPSASLMMVGFAGALTVGALLALRALVQPFALSEHAARLLCGVWDRLAWDAVDAVHPSPHALRGAIGIQDGQRGRIVGHRPERAAPLVAVNDCAFAEMCASFDDDHAALLASRDTWARRLRPMRPPRHVEGVKTVAWLLWFTPMVAWSMAMAVHVDPVLPIPTGFFALTDLLLVLLCAPLYFLLYGLVYAVVGAAAWLRALMLSARAEQDRAAAAAKDAVRRSSAASLIRCMRKPGGAVNASLVEGGR
ncbi:MAG: hypothetical protein AAFV53_18565 [Myxococcota bacterium]